MRQSVAGSTLHALLPENEADLVIPAKEHRCPGMDATTDTTNSTRGSKYYINVAFIPDKLALSKDGDKEKPESWQPKQPAPAASKNGVLAVVRRSRWMITLIYTHIWISAAFSLMQPFFPQLASSAGLEAWKYGFFFSATKIAMLVGSVLTERFMLIVSPRWCYLTGQVGFILFTIFLGLLYWSPGGDVFLAVCLVLALIGGFFSTVYIVSAYSVVTAAFPVHTGMIIATMEFMWGAGNMLGSVLGGILIDAWEYPLPFFVMAALSSFSLPWTVRSKKISAAPIQATQQTDEAGSPNKRMNLYKLLIDPVFLIDMGTVMLSWVIMGFNEPTLEPHLQQFGINTTQLGIIFMVQFASYTVACPVLGTLCHLKMDAFCAFVCQSITVFAYVLLGPAPFIPTATTMWMVYLSQVFTGVGMAGQFICGYCHALKHAVAKGYSDDLRTTSFISTAVFTVLVLGATVMPPIAGYLVEQYGYRTGSMFLFGLLVFWTPVTFFQWVKHRFTEKKKGRQDTTTT